MSDTSRGKGYSRQAEEWIEKAIARVDADEVVKLAADLVDIPSRTGEEATAARFMIDFMDAAGFETHYQAISETRGNAVGYIRGSGGGPTLAFNGHLDTSWVGADEEDYPIRGEHDPTLYALYPQATVKDGWLSGLGCYNMKGGLAAMTLAMAAIKRAGIPLKGDVAMTAVSGEIEKSPVKSLYRDYRGRHFHGGAFGTEYLLKHGFTADCSVVGEPSGGHVSWVNAGYCWFKILTRGKVVNAAIVKEKAVNAILEMTKVIGALEEWSPKYAERNKTDMLRPVVNVDAIESGWPYKLSFSPAICAAYVDVRIVPGQKPEEVRRELQKIVGDAGTVYPVKVEMYMSNVGEQTDPESWIVQSCIRAHERIRGTAHEKPYLPSSNVWADCNVFRRYGIPSAMLGPGDVWSPTEHQSEVNKIESISVRSLVDATRMYIAAAIDTCGRSRDEVVSR